MASYNTSRCFSLPRCARPIVEVVPELVAHLRRTLAGAQGCGFPHYSDYVIAPPPWRERGLAPQRGVWTPINFPPARVWRYMRAAA